jgi:hypothetical protein
MDELRPEVSAATPAGTPRMSARFHAAALAAACLVVMAGGSACRAAGAAMLFADTFPTKEAAAQAVLQALWERNPSRLDALAVSEVEFRKTIWPRLPASRASVGMPVDYVWSDVSLRSRGELAQILETFGGRRLTLEGVRFAGRTIDYGTFRDHSKTEITVRNSVGLKSTVRLFGSMIEIVDRWKIYSYVVD